MIVLCWSKCYVIQLKDDSHEVESGHVQRGMKGHVIVYPQCLSLIATSLPPSIEDITASICMIFVSAQKPTDEWLQDHVKLLAWLKRNNPLYCSIVFNKDVLQELDSNPVLPISIQHVLPSSAGDSLTSRYDAPESTERLPNVVIMDIDSGMSSNNLHAAAIRHIKCKGRGYIQIPQDPEPVKEFYNPTLFPMMYPTLFPYGVGGMEDKTRIKLISLKAHIKHYFSLNDT
ncbi:hypothetical protein F5146DRAFT_1099821 [Armillaria mellea]|nr:hypothetical protein F5146DRAFT_1099821 [Armillaria mellea]